VRSTTLFIGTALLIAGAPSVFADESAIELRKASGVDVIETNCGTCHSLDYVQMNSPIQDKEGWTKTVDKMIKVFGAPIDETDQKTIIDYLAVNYGK